MSRRIEIELTSARADGSWTWRAAGAKEPRGTLDSGLLPAGTKAGDVLRAEADFEIEGITIIAVLPPRTSSRVEAERIEIIGSGRSEAGGVTTQLTGRSDRRPGDRRRDREDGRGRRERDGGRPQGGRDTARPRRDDRAAGGDSSPQQMDPADRAEGAGRGDRSAPSDRSAPAGRPDGSERGPRSERTERERGAHRPGTTSGRPGSQRGTGDPATPAGERPGRRGPDRGADSGVGAERRARRFSPGRAHRQAVMASLPAEQQPIAEQVLRGGIPAVRTALHLEREKAVAEGRPVPNTDQLIAMAESLLPRLKAAEWRDRAEAAAKDVDDISLRDLRSVVAGADAARDDETRALAVTLREALDRRVGALRSQWTDEVAGHLDERRVVRALRLAGRPPEPAARLDAELTQRLSDAASEAMTPETPTERWQALLEAVAASPVRRTVKPTGLPADATPELRRAAHQQSGRIPALAAMLGVSIPPPPAPASPRRPAGGPGGGTTPAGGPGSPAPSGAAPSGAAPSTPTPSTPTPSTPTPSSPTPSSPTPSSPAPTSPHPVTADAAPEGPSTEGGQDPVVVQELGQTLDQG